MTTKTQRHKAREEAKRTGAPVPEWAKLRTEHQRKADGARVMTFDEYKARQWCAWSKYRVIDSSGVAWEYQNKPTTRYFNYGGEWSAPGRCACIGDVSMLGVKWKETLMEKQ